MVDIESNHTYDLPELSANDIVSTLMSKIIQKKGCVAGIFDPLLFVSGPMGPVDLDDGNKSLSDYGIDPT